MFRILYVSCSSMLRASHNSKILFLSSRLLLPGELFFLRIIHSKSLKPDIGTYYCNATNIYGSAISRNASLILAGKLNVH